MQLLDAASVKHLQIAADFSLYACASASLAQAAGWLGCG